MRSDSNEIDSVIFVLFNTGFHSLNYRYIITIILLYMPMVKIKRKGTFIYVH